MSQLEEKLALQMKAYKIPEPEREYRFDYSRKWRIDFAWPTLLRPLAVEVEGGSYGRGRHVRPVGFRNDCRKYNSLAIAGWLLLRFDSSMVNSGEAIDVIRGVFR